MTQLRRSPVLLAAVAFGLALLAGAAFAQSTTPPKQSSDRDPARVPTSTEPGKTPASADAPAPGKAAPRQDAPKPRRGGKDPERELEEEEDI